MQEEEQAIQEQVITAEAAVVEDQLESQTYQSYTLVRAEAEEDMVLVAAEAAEED